MLNKEVTLEEALAHIKSGQCLMVGGFLGVGTPEGLVDGILGQNITGLTLIASDTAFPDKGVGKLVAAGRVKKAIVSHIGTNPLSGKKMNSGEMEVVLTPQGTLAEQVRAGGAGLGGVLTPTGIGTIVERGKEALIVDGKKYLLEKPLKADVALLRAWKADRAGNLVFRKAARNFNPLMAMAAEWVIAEAEELVETGGLDHDSIDVPGVLVDQVVMAEGSEQP